jgi:hypothetical protein
VVSVRCPIAVEEAEALLGSLMALGTDHGSVLQLDQLLQAVACQLGHQLPGRAAIEQLRQAGGSGISIEPWFVCLR